MTTTTKEIERGLHPSWAGVDERAWRWPHFTARELSCKCGSKHCRGEYFHNPEFLDALERLRSAMGAPLVVTSGRRCPGHNRAVGGASRSQHMLAIAGDISTFGHDPKRLVREAVRAGFRGVGFGSSFLHLDWRASFTPFHYDGSVQLWRNRFGFDPVDRLRAGGAL